jgi:DNA uptake protein ComE-like DNA-binding protein
MHTGSKVALRSLFFHMRRFLVLVGVGGLLALVAGVSLAAAAQPGNGDVASKGETSADGSTPGKVDLNRASAEEISKLAGVSAEVAERIVRHRPYKKLDDLVTRKILGKKEFARIREQVVVGRTDR